MNWYNPNPGGSTSPAGLRGNDADAMNGNAVMFDAVAGQILTMGGAPSYQVCLALTLNPFTSQPRRLPSSILAMNTNRSAVNPVHTI